MTVETCLEADCVVQATQDDLYQIAFNLVENAIKYNLPQGTVTVTLFVRGKERHPPGGGHRRGHPGGGSAQGVRPVLPG